jgi:hypothetical protein
MDTLAVQLTVPPIEPVRDLHPLVNAPCRAHNKKALYLIKDTGLEKAPRGHRHPITISERDCSLISLTIIGTSQTEIVFERINWLISIGLTDAHLEAPHHKIS